MALTLTKGPEKRKEMKVLTEKKCDKCNELATWCGWDRWWMYACDNHTIRLPIGNPYEKIISQTKMIELVNDLEVAILRLEDINIEQGWMDKIQFDEIFQIIEKIKEMIY